MTAPADLRPVVTYARDAILDVAHVCAALGACDDTILKMDLPCFYVGNRARFIWGQVLDELSHRAGPDAQPRPEARRRSTRRKRKAESPKLSIEA